MHRLRATSATLIHLMRRRDTCHNALAVDPREFPEKGSLAEKMRFFLRYAVLAPSPFNTQPWRYRVRQDGTVEFFFDRTRRLAALDPNDRLMHVALGSTLKLFLLVAEAFEYDLETELFPDGLDAELVARVRPSDDAYVTGIGRELLPAVAQRQTGWGEFARGDLADHIRAHIRSMLDGMAEIRFEFVTDLIARQELAEIVGEANRRLFKLDDMRNELADWMRTSRNGATDGLPVEALELGPFRTAATVRKKPELGERIAEREREHLLNAPLVLVVGTEEDKPELWPAVGGAWVVTELIATQHHLRSAVVHAPLLLREARAQVQESLYDETIVPQQICRFGYAPPLVPEPRRTLEQGLLLE